MQPGLLANVLASALTAQLQQAMRSFHSAMAQTCLLATELLLSCSPAEASVTKNPSLQQTNMASS
jgi:hypothetical protein